ncbi:MAG: glutamate--tRNA ligase [Gammaproteobacteria bacterium]|nr:glutamate--tRNA ligase [Rhodocyclaceae bacterium]MBU3909123.1 glutamate--tRNA ligase [Gammaproteobacteria bacterium]MBU3988129.1 glutamate--tRNA ligase [Gammaproteobacteria bacterium]MBU4003334.1 glutamate--tRNA ligase [Gammaproteobacteria bacterium]MBU4022166.1 glutamate--tRNA ligase [Gammaproteobacteria bacterium]
MTVRPPVVRTRFAPSPTGYLHIGGARTALFAWAYARHHSGQFILRIEDTDVARSTPEAVQAILDGMQWLGLAHDEGPFYQMERMDRYKEVIGQMLAAGTAYHCYTSIEELDVLRAAQEANKEKPRYDGLWRPEPGKTLPSIPPGLSPVVRFKNPAAGVVAWDDLVKGRIEIANAELDDFIIARADGTPTYNFCVVVDDSDMQITHVIRGDDHVNNTPRQINLLQALGALVPRYGHVSMILGDDGTKLSKRHGAVSVMQYEENGYLPEAVLNYLARLGWSHGDEEVFSLEQFVTWFDLDHITASAAQFNTEKLNWLNAHYIKLADDARLGGGIVRRLVEEGVPAGNVPDPALIASLYKDRVVNLNELADCAHPFYASVQASEELTAQHLTAPAIAALADLRTRLANVEWVLAELAKALKETLAATGLKMPQVAIPLRVALLGQPQSPAIDRVLAVLGREETLRRLDQILA